MIQITIALVIFLLVGIYFRKVFSPNQLENTVNNYFEGFPYHENTPYKIHGS